MAIGDKIKFKEDAKLQKEAKFNKTINDFCCPSKESVIVQDYIQPYLTELSGEARKAGIYQNRLARSYPITITESILHQHHAPLDQQITIKGYGSEDDEDPTLQDEVLENVDGEQTTAQQMFSNQIYEHLKKGRHAILIEKELGSDRSYQTIFENERIKRIERFKSGKRRGQLREVQFLLESFEEETKNKTFTEKEKRVRYFFAETEEGFSENYTMQIIVSETNITNIGAKKNQENTWQVVQEVEGELDRLPIVLFGNGMEDSQSRRTIDYDIAIINRASIWSNINYNQGFQRSAYFGIPQSERDLQIGENIASFFSDPAGHIDTIAPGDPKAIKEEIIFLVNQGERHGMYRSTQLNPESKEAPSMESKFHDEKNRIKVYDTIINYFEPRMREIYQIHALFEGLDPAGIEVSIARDYGIESKELRLMQNSIVREWARDFGEPGQIILNQIMAQEIMEMELIIPDVQEGQEPINAEQYRKTLIQDILNYKPTPRADILSFRQPLSLASQLPDDEEINEDEQQAA